MKSWSVLLLNFRLRETNWIQISSFRMSMALTTAANAIKLHKQRFRKYLFINKQKYLFLKRTNF